MSLVRVKNLSVFYHMGKRNESAVWKASFGIGRGEIVALVGGSGSGKSTVAMAIGRLTDFVPCDVSGVIMFKDRIILKLGEEEIRQVRRSEIAYVFQEPATSLNPVFSIRSQLGEALEEKSEEAAYDLLRAVQLADVRRIANAYPHELSGGMKQRAMIAMALAKKPDLLIADEPTTALDVTVQKEILRLLVQLKAGKDLSILFITHDIKVASAIADRILIMHRGEIVEEILDPKHLVVGHAYSRRLLNCATTGRKPKTYFEV